MFGLKSEETRKKTLYNMTKNKMNRKKVKNYGVRDEMKNKRFIRGEIQKEERKYDKKKELTKMSKTQGKSIEME